MCHASLRYVHKQSLVKYMPPCYSLHIMSAKHSEAHNVRAPFVVVCVEDDTPQLSTSLSLLPVVSTILTNSSAPASMFLFATKTDDGL